MTPELAQALLAAQRAVKPVGKSSTNSHHDYKYASGDDMVAEARAALNGAGLAVYATRWERIATPFQYQEDGKTFDDVELRLSIQFRLVHESGACEDFAAFSVPILPERGRPIDKAEAGARTYALAYFLRDLLLIPRTASTAQRSETEPDGRDDRAYVPPRTAKPRPTPKPADPKPRTPADVRRRYERMRGDFPAEVAAIKAKLLEFGGPETDPAAVPPAAAQPAFAALGLLARQLLEKVPAAPEESDDVGATTAAAPAATPEAADAGDDEPRPNSPEDLGVNRSAPAMTAPRPTPAQPPKRAESLGGLSAKVRETRSRCDHLGQTLGMSDLVTTELARIGKVVWEPEGFPTVDQARALQSLAGLNSRLLAEQAAKTPTATAAT